MVIASTISNDGADTTWIGVMAAEDRMPAGKSTAEFVGAPLGRLPARPLDPSHPTAKMAAEYGCRYLRLDSKFEQLHRLTGKKGTVELKIDGQHITTLTLADREAIGTMVAKINVLRHNARRRKPSRGR
jgi:hypothetical protein